MIIAGPSVLGLGTRRKPSGGGGGSFSPADIALLWLSKTGSDPAVWPDVTGNGYDALQPLTAQQPDIGTVSGKQGRIFDSPADKLFQIPWSSGLDITSAMSFAVVLIPDDTSIHQGVFEKGDWNATYGLLMINGNVPRFAINGNYSDGAALTFGSRYLLTGTFDGSTIKTYANGTLTSSATYSGAIATNGANLFIGAEGNGWPTTAARWPFMRTMHELVLANTAWDSTQRHNIETYFGDDYGISIP